MADNNRLREIEIELALRKKTEETPFYQRALKRIKEGVGLVETGIYKGIADVIGLPGDLQQGVAAGAEQTLTTGEAPWGVRQLNDLANAIGVPGIPVQNVAVGALKDVTSIPTLPTSEDVQRSMQSSGRDLAAIGLPTAEFTEPETGVGRVVQQAARFGAGGLAGGRFATTLAASGGAAGQLAQEADMPVHVQIAAELMAPIMMTLARSGWAAFAPDRAQRVLRQALQGVSVAEIRRANALVLEAQQRGAQLTWPEAIAQVTNGRISEPLGWQRVAEQSLGGGPTMSNFMEQRTVATPGMVQGELRQLGPQATDPSAIPFRMQRAAEGAIGAELGVMRNMTRPLFEQAAGDVINPAIVQDTVRRVEALIARTPVGPTRRQLEQFRNELMDPAIPGAPERVDVAGGMSGGPTRVPGVQGVPERPITDVGRLRQITQYWRDKLDMPTDNSEEAAALKALSAQLTPHLDVLNSAMRSQSPTYDRAMGWHAAYMDRNVTPLKQGPTGLLAETSPELGAQRSVMASHTPTVQTPENIRQTVVRLQREDPEVARQWMRLNLEAEFDQLARGMESGQNQWGAGEFALAIASGRAGQNLEAFITALPNGAQRWRGLQTLFAILQAQGRRLPTGLAAVEAEGQAFREMARGRVPIASRPMSKVQQWVDDWRRGVNTRALAELITDPTYGRRLEALVTAPAERRVDYANGLLADWAMTYASRTGEQEQ